MIVPDVLIPQLAEKLRHLQQEALAAIQADNKEACESALNEQLMVIDSLIELDKGSARE